MLCSQLTRRSRVSAGLATCSSSVPYTFYVASAQRTKSAKLASIVRCTEGLQRLVPEVSDDAIEAKVHAGPHGRDEGDRT